MRRLLPLLALLATLAAAAPSSARRESPRLTVFAAASLTEVFPRIDPRARYSFAGSDQLAYQIEQGAPADVYAAASPKFAEQLFDRGLVERPRVLATNELVLIVPASNPARVRSVRDLRRPGVKLVVGQKGLPIGDYTRTVLRRLHLATALHNVVSEEQDVKGIVGKVALGEADAGFVYLTDVKPVAGRVREIRLPAHAQPTVRYEIAVVRSSKNLAAARAFVARVLSPSGRQALAQAGFGLP